MSHVADVDFRTMLHNTHLKATPARLAVLEALKRAKKPLTIETILDTVKPPIDKTTAYRMLTSLRDNGVVREIDLQHGHAHYELEDKQDHHHLVCRICGKTEDFTGCDFKEIKRRALKQSKHFSKAAQHSLEIFGICKSCERSNTQK